ncbi:MAG: glycosyltransferase family 2 protein [Atopobiaceae bacterium]|nr:glycosyltransferase family 2 protein [Atopobiaceae bacterium]
MQPPKGEVRVSVIIPVYNVGPHIGRCIESLRAQLLDGLEFVFVDDRSTDGSMAAVEAWAAQDPRVRILRNAESLGPGPSRNRGIEAARGDYLSFVDPHDWVAPDFHELLYAAAAAGGGHDVAKGLGVTAGPDGRASGLESRRLNERIAGTLREGLPLYRCFTREHQSALYRRALVKRGTGHGSSQIERDTTFLLAVTLPTDDIVFEEHAVYHYVKQQSPAGPDRYAGELDALAEQAGLLEPVANSEHARDYLRARTYASLMGLYADAAKDPSLGGAVDAYAQRLGVIVGGSPALRFLREDSAACRALLEHRALLPVVDCLPDGQKMAGAEAWIDFLREYQILGGPCTNACAIAMADAIQLAAAKKGRDGLWYVHMQLKKKLSSLPKRNRIIITLKTYRRLANKHNLQAIIRRIGRRGAS